MMSVIPERRGPIIDEPQLRGEFELISSESDLQLVETSEGKNVVGGNVSARQTTDNTKGTHSGYNKYTYLTSTSSMTPLVSATHISEAGFVDTESHHDIDNDILDIVKACQTAIGCPSSDVVGISNSVPSGAMNGKCGLKSLLTPNNLQLNTEQVSHGSGDKKSTLKGKSYTQSHQGTPRFPDVTSTESRHSGYVYGATIAPYKKPLEWATYPVKSLHSSDKESKIVDGSFTEQVNALKNTLKHLEDGDDDTVVNLVHSTTKVNWKSLIKLMEKNPAASSELMGLYVQAQRKRPVLGKTLAPALQKINRGEVQRSSSRLRVEGCPLEQTSFKPNKRNCIETTPRLTPRQISSKKYVRTPGEIALLEGKESNMAGSRKRSKKSVQSDNASSPEREQLTLYLPQMGRSDSMNISGYFPEISNKHSDEKSHSPKSPRRTPNSVQGHLYKTSPEYGHSKTIKSRARGSSSSGTSLPKVNGNTNISSLSIQSQHKQCKAPNSSMASIDSYKNPGIERHMYGMLPLVPAPTPMLEQEMIQIPMTALTDESRSNSQASGTHSRSLSRLNGADEPNLHNLIDIEIEKNLINCKQGAMDMSDVTSERSSVSRRSSVSQCDLNP